MWKFSQFFFSNCDKYKDNREILLNSLNWLPFNINIDINLLTKGNDFLTSQENTTIFRHAFEYIKDSKRSTIVYMIKRTNTHLQKYVFLFLFFRILSLPMFLYKIILCLFIFMHIIYLLCHFIAHATTYCK